MNTTIVQNSIRFVVLLLAQLLIFSNINFLGYINPYPYILYIILFPINGNKNVFLITSFLLGLLLDMFLDSGGIHATASLVLAYVRPTLFRFAFGLSYEYQTIKISDKITSERIMFLLLAIVIHSFILFSLEIFRISLLHIILVKTIVSAIATFCICLLIILFIKPNKR